MKQGIGNSEACRIVGISRSSGTRWRHGHTVVLKSGDIKKYAPISHQRPAVISARFLSESERITIADLLHARRSIRAIAMELGRSPSTVSREIRRNIHKPSGNYRPRTAQRSAERRRSRQRSGKIAGNPELQDFVREHLEQRWSPRQISNRLRAVFPEQPEMHVVPETVYQALYGRGRLDLAVNPAVSLRTGRTGRRPRRRKEHRTKRFPDMVMIRDRPAEVTSRLVPGHWEGDLIIGKGSRSAIATLVERTTRFIILVHLAGNRGAENLRDRLAETMSALPAHLRRSLTWDQGTEMACHQDFTQRTLMPVYFCDPASPWQRGSNENTNGLLRQYFPKGTDLGVHTAEHLASVANQLNRRPREVLGWESPLERLTTLGSPLTDS
ncbi:IS30 family transposase [Arthrobacter globiformis]|uniref:IS30 family transposase n=1 Tax=Arthrobacter globiformis TaxID=1665 RepID=UPI00278F8603|nr:IS30 family transposase [Arthrobacter globiformis]MDQ0618521.1 IS30 family transposase [Arthrobacter globiformis]MDQ0620105.1 IS30 family transposase [Arthrobacter globiformis]